MRACRRKISLSGSAVNALHDREGATRDGRLAEQGCPRRVRRMTDVGDTAEAKLE